MQSWRWPGVGFGAIGESGKGAPIAVERAIDMMIAHGGGERCGVGGLTQSAFDGAGEGGGIAGGHRGMLRGGGENRVDVGRAVGRHHASAAGQRFDQCRT